MIHVMKRTPITRKAIKAGASRQAPSKKLHEEIAGPTPAPTLAVPPTSTQSWKRQASRSFEIESPIWNAMPAPLIDPDASRE